ncbi:MAG: bifunctional aldolase/short-chain dehydrogenase [Acidimicrobiales bacterium]|nr:bifunctional aldolase/short-chain dehydrogenase [Acidimicrobiales bacterium]MYA83596.1 bifunctional aldolase/short-chain dehydrogenase [Acidimicrobiales bacterium]MYD34447.1 bifunctional aldolase/short-chain dehydrogenase [Acidimicrobiales bacterium]MYH76084.1 bifunctional aldolase/short-chain dehydrogenase [Acidimicrobiales bacterium]MYI09124.1 bifunctional aldolase/short-chain dehydrogenase [Acidimicrobiales bacterium]
MLNRWDADEATRWTELGDLGEITYGSRLVGADPALVLHGGGNTSIKGRSTDAWGEPVPTLWVKGSGWDLATIEPPGFAPLRLEPVRRLAELAELSDTEMVNQLRIHLLDASAPNPSVEAILHALLPHRAVLHSHADAVLALTNTAEGEARVRDLWGDRAVVVPYVMPGFDLARRCADEWQAQAHDGTEAMVLLNHGIFTFGETARQAYDSMIDRISEAEQCLAEGGVTSFGEIDANAAGGRSTHRVSLDAVKTVAELRTAVSAAAGAPMLLRAVRDDRADAFCARDDLASVACRGPATPDHIIRTKQFPMVGRDVAAFVGSYRSYFERNADRHAEGERLTMLDTAPRVILDPDLGLWTVGRRAVDCDIAADIYRHTIDVINAAETLGGYVALGEADLFDVEYWELEQAKLARAGAPAGLAGQVALVTGAASGIGQAAAAALASAGAAVVGIDIDAGITHEDGGDSDRPSSLHGSAWLGIEADVTDADAMTEAVADAVERFGGIDIVVAAAGIFGPSAPLEELVDDSGLGTAWQQTFDINVSGAANTLAAAHRVMRHSPAGGRVVIVGSKNVPAPGKGAAAYSASKAALTQLARVAALEWAPDGITVNVVHPDGVFDTGLWSDELIAQRAVSYGLTPEQYRRRNLLGRELASADVGALIAQMCGPAFAHTTGAQIPQDGGSDRVV